MKKYIFLAIVCLFSTASQAVPLVINNNSGSGVYPGDYEAHSYLSFIRDGDPCNVNDNALYFIFQQASSLYIGDGSFVYTSPFNGVSNCLSTFLGYSSCTPAALDWTGQRFWLEGDYSFNPASYLPTIVYAYPAGLIGLSTGGVQCHPEAASHYSYYNETATSYDMVGYATLNPPIVTTGNVCRITYNRFGNVLATLNYE